MTLTLTLAYVENAPKIVLPHSMIGYWHDTVICPSGCDEVYCV